MKRRVGISKDKGDDCKSSSIHHGWNADLGFPATEAPDDLITLVRRYQKMQMDSNTIPILPNAADKHKFIQNTFNFHKTPI